MSKIKYVLTLFNYTKQDYDDDSQKMLAMIRENETDLYSIDYDRSFIDNTKNDENTTYEKSIIKEDNKEMSLYENTINGLKLSGRCSTFDYNDKNVTDTSKHNSNINTNKFENIYSPLPKTFKNINKWPKKTNLLCLNCGCKIICQPIFIPKSINKYKKKVKGELKEIIEKEVFGCFHHFACATAYIQTLKITNENKMDMIEMLKDLYFDFYNKRIKYIHPAEDKSVRSCYGGQLDDKEWYALIDNNHEIHSLLL